MFGLLYDFSASGIFAPISKAERDGRTRCFRARSFLVRRQSAGDFGLSVDTFTVGCVLLSLLFEEISKTFFWAFQEFKTDVAICLGQ